MNNILVTGAAGFIGSHLVDALLKSPDTFVVAVDNLDEYYLDQKKDNLATLQRFDRCTVALVDIRDRDAMERLFVQYSPTAVVHLAARPGVRSSFETAELHWQINVEGTNVVIDLAKRYDVKKFLFASSSSVYGERSLNDGPFTETDTLRPVSPYARTKMQAEQNIQRAFMASATTVSILRLFSVYGERMRPDLGLFLFVEAIAHDKAIQKFGSGESLRDYTYVGDIVEAFKCLLQKDNGEVQVFNVGSSSPVSLNRAIELIAQKMQKEAIVETVERQVGDVSYTWASIEKIGKLGFRPRTSFEDGLEKFIHAYGRSSQ